MRLAPALLWRAAGCPDPRRSTSAAVGMCYWCASSIDGPACRVGDVITDSFTDQDQAFARGSPLLCVACSWAMTGRPPDTLRMWSLAYREDGAAMPPHHEACTVIPALPNVTAQNKADPSVFRGMLRSPPAAGQWFVSIADSGQVHVLPFAPVNSGKGRYGVRFERNTVWAYPDEYVRLDDAFGALMTAGFSKGEIESGEPYVSRISVAGDAWARHFPTIRPYVNSGLLGLVSFLIRKDKSDDDSREQGRPVREASDSPCASADAVGESAGDPADSVVVASQERACDSREPVPCQGSLFGDDFEDGRIAPNREPATAVRSRRDRGRARDRS